MEPRRSGRSGLAGILAASAGLVLATGAGLVLAACAGGGGSGSASPRPTVAPAQSYDLEAGYDEAWDASLASLRDLGFTVERADRPSRSIVSEWRRFTEPVGSSECGSSYWGRVRLALSDGVTGVRLTIDPTFHAGEAPDSAGARRCASNGRLERSLSRLVINRVES